MTEEDTQRLPLVEARHIAVSAMQQLQPHCEVISLAGDIRRERATIGGIEIVCVPRPASSFGAVISQWSESNASCCYTQRMLPEGITIDLFMAHRDAYGLQRAIRTGSPDWCRTVLAPAWVQAGFNVSHGMLRRANGSVVPVRTEPELFRQIGMAWVDPRDREID